MRELNDIMEEILNTIPQGCFFDSHTIISKLIEEYSDDYLYFSNNFIAESNFTLAVHGQIGQVINQFDGTLVEKQEDRSWSKNIHNNYSPCTCWKKR